MTLSARWPVFREHRRVRLRWPRISRLAVTTAIRFNWANPSLRASWPWRGIPVTVNRRGELRRQFDCKAVYQTSGTMLAATQQEPHASRTQRHHNQIMGTRHRGAQTARRPTTAAGVPGKVALVTGAARGQGGRACNAVRRGGRRHRDDRHLPRCRTTKSRPDHRNRRPPRRVRRSRSRRSRTGDVGNNLCSRGLQRTWHHLGAHGWREASVVTWSKARPN